MIKINNSQRIEEKASRKSLHPPSQILENQGWILLARFAPLAAKIIHRPRERLGVITVSLNQLPLRRQSSDKVFNFCHYHHHPHWPTILVVTLATSSAHFPRGDNLRKMLMGFWGACATKIVANRVSLRYRWKVQAFSGENSTSWTSRNNGSERSLEGYFVRWKFCLIELHCRRILCRDKCASGTDNELFDNFEHI